MVDLEKMKKLSDQSRLIAESMKGNEEPLTADDLTPILLNQTVIFKCLAEILENQRGDDKNKIAEKESCL